MLVVAAQSLAVRDGFDYLSIFSGLVGALLAAAAIGYAAWQAKRSKEDLVRERRVVFELGLLAEIRRQMSITEFQHLAGFVGALITDSTKEVDIPTVRAVIGVKSGPEGLMRLDALSRDAGVDRQRRLLAEAEIEVDAAIQRRIDKGS